MHIFLTGPKRVGKSTLLNGMLSCFPGKPGGFRTVRLNTWLPGSFTVHLLPLTGNQEPKQENLLFVCGQRDGDTVHRFNTLGCRILEESTGADLLVMDELGPHEAAAEAFQQAVRRALDGQIPILGVLQQGDAPFLQEVASHPNVRLLTVSQENRDSLAEQIPQWIEILTERRNETWQEKP